MDISSMVMPTFNGFSKLDTCIYHLEKGGVGCDGNTRTDYDCAHCGWNPQVARRRKYLIREERRKQNAGDSV